MNREVSCFLEADGFASDMVKVGNYWPTISSFLIVGFLLFRGIGIFKRDSQRAAVNVSDDFLGSSSRDLSKGNG